jgi:hypothetical protein
MDGVNMAEPEKLVSGDTWEWQRNDLAAYPASEGWTLKYVLINATDKIEIDAITHGDDFKVYLAAADTTAKAAGTYRFEASVSKNGDRYRVGTGNIEVLADFASADTLDTRSHARRVLAAIEAVIERRATKDQEEYQIDGRSLKRTAIGDLLLLRNRYRQEVVNETHADQIARGKTGGRKVVMRFGG